MIDGEKDISENKIFNCDTVCIYEKGVYGFLFPYSLVTANNKFTNIIT